MNILEEIAEKTKQRVCENIVKTSREEIKSKAFAIVDAQKKEGSFPTKPEEFCFEQALKKDKISFICEVKKASPSKGVISQEFPYLDIARDYEKAGASAISCLTEPYWFQGSDAYLSKIKETVSIPVLRKDFTVDSYMIYEAKVIGADAILLICGILDDETLEEYIKLADQLGLSALVEAHDEDEVKRALRAGARIVGVNNRDLKTFTVDINNSVRYRFLVPEDILFVSESGIKTAADISHLEKNKVNGVLIGETLMRAKDRVQALQELMMGENA